LIEIIGGVMQRSTIIRKAKDKSALNAWYEDIAQQTKQNPSLKHQLLQQQGELLPCFANHYDRLVALKYSSLCKPGGFMCVIFAVIRKAALAATVLTLGD
jgi:hypothetical protein